MRQGGKSSGLKPKSAKVKSKMNTIIKIDQHGNDQKENQTGK